MRKVARQRRRWPFVVLGVAVAPAAIVGASLGYGLQFDLPDVRALEDYTPPLNTRVLARDGSVLASLGEQRRRLVSAQRIPEVFENALLAVEDADFYGHHGIDFRGIARAAWHDLRTMSFRQGASTLTQQLARNLFLKPDKTLRRKFQEMVLAMEIERSYSKQEILGLYCNQVYMGHGRYGVEAASHHYFGKSVTDLDLAEAATLAGIIQRPESLSPLRNPDRTLKRREHVLDRMVAEGMISPPEAEEAKAAPLAVAPSTTVLDIAPYFVEEVRRHLQATHGGERVYRAGLEVRTTLDPRLQEIAASAVDTGLRQVDRRQGWRGVATRIPDDADPAEHELERWSRGVRIGDVVPGIVVRVTKARAEVRAGPYTGSLGAAEIAWTGQESPSSLLRAGDVVSVRLVEDPGEERARMSLEQEPLVEGALIAIDPATGAVRALVGGFDYERSEFDRAVQAKRQAGSAFKPIVYAAALNAGRTASERILDEPTVFFEPRTLALYQPENYGDKYFGAVTLRRALERSANIATVKLLDEIGYDAVIDTARRLGITTPLQPYPSLALGAFEVSLLEITSAYGTFANHGVRVEPFLVEEVLGRDDRTIERAKPRVQEALSPGVARIVTHMLEGVVTDGTGIAAARLGRPVAGKTGTTDDYTDAWFVGFTPELVVGVWVGFDVKKPIGKKETGARAALPIWREFVGKAHEGEPPLPFPTPPEVVRVAVDRNTGLRANTAAGCRHVLVESFVAGTEPTAYCSRAEHERNRFPYPLHRYPLNDEGEIEIPVNELDELLFQEPTIRLTRGGRALAALRPDGTALLALEILPERAPEPTPLPPEILEAEDPPELVGKDGRPASVYVLRR